VCVVYWYSFSNPRTKCIHCNNCLVIKKRRVLSFPPQILADLPSRVSAQFDACHLDSGPTLPAYLCRIGGHVLTKAIILSTLCMSLSHFSFLSTFLFSLTSFLLLFHSSSSSSPHFLRPYAGVARSRSGSSSFTASALNKPSSS